jgi:hypothetical protein
MDKEKLMMRDNSHTKSKNNKNKNEWTRTNWESIDNNNLRRSISKPPCKRLSLASLLQVGRIDSRGLGHTIICDYGAPFAV